MPIVSRAFDPWKHVPGASRFADLVGGIVDDIEKVERKDEVRGKKRGQRDLSKVHELVEAILVDLFVAHHTSSKLCLGVNLNANWYTANKDRLPHFLTYKRFEPVLRYLGNPRLGYVIEVKGGYRDREKNRGRNTKIRASEKLIARLANEAKLKLCDVLSSTTSAPAAEEA